MTGLGLLEFLASEMYQADCARKGTIGVRWMCLREDVGRKYLKRAEKACELWATDERRAEARRKGNDPLAFFDHESQSDASADAK